MGSRSDHTDILTSTFQTSAYKIQNRKTIGILLSEIPQTIVKNSSKMFWGIKFCFKKLQKVLVVAYLDFYFEFILIYWPIFFIYAKVATKTINDRITV